MEGKSDTEKSSFLIVDLLQRNVIRKECPETPMELTTYKPQSSPSGSTSTSSQATPPRHFRERFNSKAQTQHVASPVCYSPESPQPNRRANLTSSSSPPLYPVIHLHHPAYQFHAHHFPHIGTTFPRLFGMESSLLGNAPMSLDTTGDGSRGQHHHTHAHHPSSFIASSPTTSPGLTSLFHSDGVHSRSFSHVPPEYSMWHGNGSSASSGPGPHMVTPYPDPRLYEFPYPASSLLSRIACGMDCLSGRGPHPLFNGESKRKGGQIRFSNAQTSQLEKAFVEHKYQNAHERRKLAHSLGLTDRQVKTWFQNRRAKWRKVGEKDEPSDNKSHPTGYDDNLRHALLDRSTSSSASEENSLTRHDMND